MSALRAVLRDRNAYLVAKAAELAAEAGDAVLVPELLGAYDLFFEDGAKRDPQVWGKNAIARALRALGHRDPGPFVRGLHHVQLEPVWGKVEDMAANLRCACAEALVDTDLPPQDALRELLPLLVDAFAVVRVEAVNAIAQLGGHEAALLLRLKALSGDAEAEVVGACFGALLDREPADAIRFIAPFLDHEDDELQLEAAASLALSRHPDALGELRGFLARPPAREVREAAIKACAGSPQPTVVDLLLEIVRGGDVSSAASAIGALAQSRFREAARERVWTAVSATRDGRLVAVWEDAFGGDGTTCSARK